MGVLNYIFNVDNDFKTEYLNSKPTQTARTELFVLRSCDEYEQIINKSVYNMSYLELKEMFAMQYHNSSIASVMKNISILKSYVEFCINKKIVEHGENRIEVFTIDDAENIVNKQATLNKFITREKLKKYQDMLCNEQDKLLIELPFIGVRGRSKKEGAYEEIINLSMPNIQDEKDNVITLVKKNGRERKLRVENSTMSLIRDTYESEIYIENNGEETGRTKLCSPREIEINKLERYVFRIPGKNKFKLFSPSLLSSRLVRIKIWVDNPYLSYISLYHAGMVQMAMDTYKDKGEVTARDYEKICFRFNYGEGSVSASYHNIKRMFEQYRKTLEEQQDKD